MQKKLVLLLVVLFVMHCNEDRGMNPLPVDVNPLAFTIGQEWSYKRLFINQGLSQFVDMPDTIIGYSDFVVAKDTVIDSKDYLIIEGTHYEASRDTVIVSPSRVAVHLADSLAVYEFQGSGGTIDGPFKVCRNQSGAQLSPTTSMYAFRDELLRKRLHLADYDTSVYYDFFFPVIFPLTKDSSWYYRPAGDPNGNLPIRKTYVGQETVTIGLGTFQAYRFNLEVNELWAGSGIDSIFWYDWVGQTGLLKRFSDYGSMTSYDELGAPNGTFTCFDVYEYLGAAHIDPDTLVPWGKRRNSGAVAKAM